MGLQEAQDAVRLNDGVLRLREDLAHAGHGFGEAALFGANPPGVIGTGDEKTRTVGDSTEAVAGFIVLFGDGPGVVSGGAVAGGAVGGADAVAVLGDFESGPVEIGQGSDEAGDDAGFADAARVSADDEDGHGRWGFGAASPVAPQFILVDKAVRQGLKPVFVRPSTQP